MSPMLLEEIARAYNDLKLEAIIDYRHRLWSGDAFRGLALEDREGHEWRRFGGIHR